MGSHHSGAHGDHDMGHTVAGWTGTALAVGSALVTGAALVAGSPVGLWVGLADLVLAVLITWALHLLGWGKASGPRPAGLRDWRVRDVPARRGHAGCVGCRIAGRRGPRPVTPAPAPVEAAAPEPESCPTLIDAASSNKG
ncbi:HGxxPAAW family protein [Streptomyces sp. NPDC059070]|uniref:HGxxPAAW family protein n=1 Tax=unclassified Streptomyces TaxID=2593676 RepID=UPI0034E2C281